MCETKLEKLLQYSRTLTKKGNLKKHPDYHLLVEQTNFLPTNCSVSRRLWHLENNLFDIPTCKVCNNYVTWRKEKGGFYSDYCSSKCAHSPNTKVRQQIEQTNKQKYGSKSPFGCKEVQQKTKQTWKQKYGVKNISQLQQIKAKKIQTSQNHYGTNHPLQHPNVLNKVQQTAQQRYGHPNVLCSNYGQVKTTQTNMIKYQDVTHARDPHVREKTKQTNKQLYGTEHPWNTDSPCREKRNQTMINKYGSVSVPNNPIKQSTKTKLLNPDWLLDQHVFQQKTLTKIGTELFVNPETVRTYIHNNNIPVQTRPTSQGERDLTTWIKTVVNDVTVNTRSIIPPYELDIFIQSHNLAIEYCGLYWHSEQKDKDKWYHHNKWKMCNDKGIHLITIFEDEWNQKQQLVKESILHKLNIQQNNKYYARKLTVAKVPKQQKQRFFEQNHIQGDSNSTIAYGLYKNDHLLAAISMIKRQHYYELNRYATNAHVVGGMSKLLRAFIRENQPQQIVTFADLRWNTGNMYQKVGFTFDKIIDPDYFYSPDGFNRFHKFNYRRKYLPDRLQHFDPQLSEKQNCDNNGILRIWDCGKKRWVLQL